MEGDGLEKGRGYPVKGADGGVVRSDNHATKRDKLVKKDGERGREDGGRGNRGADVLHLLGKVCNKVVISEGGRKGRGDG